MSRIKLQIVNRPSGVGRVVRLVVLAHVAAGLIATSSVATIAADDPSPAPLDVAEALVVTPSQGEGPYYPVELPQDHDVDLTVVTGAAAPALGQPLVIDGWLLTSMGTPVEDAVVEIWQTDYQGIYLHPQDPLFSDHDAGFQGYGESATDASGSWSFRTILPEIYGGRPRHIHAKVKVDGETVLTTQIYFSGGDISQDGAVALSGGDADALVVEVLRDRDDDDGEILRARHLIVLPVTQPS